MGSATTLYVETVSNKADSRNESKATSLESDRKKHQGKYL